jgi:hypothetical protein
MSANNDKIVLPFNTIEIGYFIIFILFGKIFFAIVKKVKKVIIGSMCNIFFRY